MLPRFLAPDAGGDRADVLLPDEEAHHATRVMRLREGDELVVFNGRGREWRARIVADARGAVRVSLLEALEPVPEPRTRLTLAQAVLKGDHMDAVVRDATMIGVTAFVPIVTERTVARVDASTSSKVCTRWHRVALASAKQCGRATLPHIDKPHTLQDLLAGFVGVHGDPAYARIVLAEPSTGLTSGVRAGGAPPAGAILAVGPEGGWSPGELAGLQAAGFEALTLGALTLRADAAALVAISVLRAGWGDV